MAHDRVVLAGPLSVERRLEFIDQNGGSPGVRLRKRQRPK